MVSLSKWNLPGNEHIIARFNGHFLPSHSSSRVCALFYSFHSASSKLPPCFVEAHTLAGPINQRQVDTPGNRAIAVEAVDGINHLFGQFHAAFLIRLRHFVLLALDGSNHLHALWKQLPGRRTLPSQARSALEQLRDLLLRLSDHWQHYCTFQSEPEVPWTNNSTERAIGRMKLRARTFRGYKSWPGMQSGLILAGAYTP